MEEAGAPHFPFPYQPYPIQEQFMQALYGALEHGKVGIFESPTGTGKSLSLICGALSWLRDHEEKRRQEADRLLQGDGGTSLSISSSLSTTTSSTPPSSSAEPDWITDFVQKKAERDFVSKLKVDEELRRKKREEHLEMIRNNSQLKYALKRKSCEDDEAVKLLQLSKDPQEGELNNPEEELIVAEYESDDESKTKNNVFQFDNIMTPLSQLDSRTHSQLAQFVHEVQKSPFSQDISLVPLGSRQNMCVNEEVRRLGSVQRINDRCMEMQKNKHDQRPKEVEGGKRKRGAPKAVCPYVGAQGLQTLRDTVLGAVRDIEQLLSLARETRSCPYYATRLAIPPAQLVVLPYQTVLHEGTRRASGVQLKGQVLIIDEAHNLSDVLSCIHSSELTGAQLCRAHSQLAQYSERYRSRLKAKNLMYIKQILFVVEGLVRVLGGKCKVGQNPHMTFPSLCLPVTELLTINNFLFKAQIDNINLFKVTTTTTRSQPQHTAIGTEIGEGIDGFYGYCQQPDTGKHTHTLGMSPSAEERELAASPMMQVEGFFMALTNANTDGRVVLHTQGNVAVSSMKFLLLNPAVHFSQVLKDCRAVIIAGGTMQPVSDFKQELLFSAGVGAERIIEFSCGHVIPPENILPIVLCSGPSGQELEFTFQNRDTPHMMEETGRVLSNLCNVVPGGVVCFFPSYDYSRRILENWDASGVLARLSSKKKIFQEPKKANQVEKVLNEFSRTIQRCAVDAGTLSGALLFSVVGGKMSEGINFSDDLGRCIVMVGMPYPNIKSPELKEKMAYLDKNLPHSGGRSPGQALIENLCMKAVNQSIGRAIRHREDYACIVLCDRRYSRPATLAKLPDWIRAHTHTHTSFGPAFASLRRVIHTHLRRNSSSYERKG
uniref:ATP-dependent DNA helicase DDX11 n=1 Tax=Oncorhynchus mykiss TaxID=8022 RepID=A0A8C7RTQ9_ONCMY